MKKQKQTGESGQGALTPSQSKPITDFPETAEDSEFFVRMFKHDFDSGSLRKPKPLADVAIILTRDRWGTDDPGLGEVLVKNLLVSLAENSQKPKFLFLLNSAVKLAVSTSGALESLQSLEAMGAKVHVNKASLDHYQLEGELRVGEVTSMMEMLDTCFSIDKVITF